MEASATERGRPGVSPWGPRLGLTALHGLVVWAVASILGASESVDPARRWVLLGCSAALFVRSVLSVWVLPARQLGWMEAAARASAAALCQLVLAAAGHGAASRLGPLDGVGLAILVAGHAIGVFAQVHRNRVSRRMGEVLCASGPFSVVRHPGLFGDLLWASGWALVAQGLLGALVPAVQLAVFSLFAIPLVETQLQSRHPAEFRAWAARTRKLVPFLY